MIWYGITWNFEHYDQANRRVYRQGQKSRTVMIYHLVATNTLDVKVMRVLKEKEGRQAKLYAAIKNPAQL